MLRRNRSCLDCIYHKFPKSCAIKKVKAMKDFIRPQIQEGCRLALPEGLQELMSDISREVLRAQPEDVPKFIADYLSALMVARENLSIAAQLCDSVCTDVCNSELEDELRYLGLGDYDAGQAKKIITNFLETGEVNEQSLMIKIAATTSIDPSLFPALLDAVRRAFRRHLINNTTLYETSSSDSDLDEVSRAAKHTLQLYRKTKHTPEEYTRAAVKIQAAYRAYGVRRRRHSRQEHSPRYDKAPDKNLQFSYPNSPDALPSFKACMPSVSSTSLAGSYLNLPRYIPYSAHAPEVLENDELAETEGTSVFYSKQEYPSTGQKKISFQDSPKEIIEDDAVLADDESEISVEELECVKGNCAHNDIAIDNFTNDDLASNAVINKDTTFVLKDDDNDKKEKDHESQ